MKRLLSSARFIAAIGVLSLFAGAFATFIWGAVATVFTIVAMLQPGGEAHELVSLIRILDIFLVGAALLIFAASLYGLFIGELDVPDWLVVKDMDELKTKMIAIVVLLMGITYLEHLVDWVSAQATALFGVGIALVSVALVFLYRSGH